jgi:threonine dehydrogenase-like Zn-dependent dehydrogenase
MFSLLLNPRLIAALLLALALSAACWKSYVVGKHSVQAEWNAERLALADKALSESVARRAREQTLINKVAKVQNDYTLQKRAGADSAAAADISLHELQTALDRARNGATLAAAGTDGDPRNVIISECTVALQALAGRSDSMAAQIIGLQAYIESVQK